MPSAAASGIGSVFIADRSTPAVNTKDKEEGHIGRDKKEGHTGRDKKEGHIGRDKKEGQGQGLRTRVLGKDIKDDAGRRLVGTGGHEHLLHVSKPGNVIE
jgi:hypothetical protein